MSAGLGNPDEPLSTRIEEGTFELVLLLDQLKDVVRENPVAGTGRREMTAEHSWHLAACVMVLKDLAAETIDMKHAVLLALFHDVPEIFVGDTFVYDDSVHTRRDREAAAMQSFAEAEPCSTTNEIVRLWKEYEYTSSAEGRFVMALDVILPVLLNHSNPEHSSWIRHGVAADQVLDRIESVQQYAPALAHYARGLVSAATADGFLRPDAVER